MSRKPIPLPVPFEEPQEDDCPKCPPPGAPAWMATFADIATLLMAFFVLILSFAEFNQPKFKMVAGSLKNAFGVQRELPVTEQPTGTTILDLKFSPAPEVTVTDQLIQDTVQIEAEEVQKPVTEEDGDGESGEDGEASAKETAEAASLAEAVEAALEEGRVHAEMRDGQVVMTFDAPTAEDLPSKLTDAAEALAEAGEATGQSTDEVMMEGLAEVLPQLAEAVRTQAEVSEAEIAEGKAERSAALAEAQLRVALRREISQGLVTIEQKKDRVVITVGAGGAFPSGDADLTPDARDVMARIAFSAMGDASNIVVTGHTDSVPLSPSSAFRDNWGLAAARASSVVRELSASALIGPERLTATSRGESAPVADNETAEGREKNRRIEIEITY
ncbi:flagellar motor protein MotB [Roseovarius aquimarinus]|uniref:Flagellar motor protein MotB n=1 Tax=Roseovarius aquimarinus TaxID=1229156 RepID=A0ABW7I6A4_9RHOB